MTCQRSNNFIYVDVRPGPIQNNGTLLDNLLCQGSFEALTPYPTSPSEQLSKVLLSSSFHRWRNWDSETLSNMLRVSQQTMVQGRARVFNPLLLAAVTPAAATCPPLHFPLHTVPWCSREEAVSFECMYFLFLEANTRLSTIASDSSWSGIFSPQKQLTQPDLPIQYNYNSATQKQGVGLKFTCLWPTPCRKAENVSSWSLFAQSQVEKTHRSIPPTLLEAWSSSGDHSPVHSHWESMEGPLKTQTGVPFHFTVKMCESLGKLGFPGTLTSP